MEIKSKIQLLQWFITIVFSIVIFAVFFRCVCLQNALLNNIIVTVFTLSLFIVSAVTFYKSFKINVGNNEKQKEFERKKEWEVFQYVLYKEEKLEKQHYETIKSLIEQLNDKDVKKEHPLKQQIEGFKKELDELKKQKDNQILVEVINSVKPKKTE
ncbi:hypothetical protein FACS189414_1100 [Bacteroidia bacterium]|nr:hypothetical protein FACS189414_1100 [Bacteroidia bacterium]